MPAADEHRPDPDRGVADALREAVERTMQATGPAAAQTRERAGELLDEVARLGQEARRELARRSQDAREGLARRGLEAGAEVGRRLEVLERRLATLEDLVRRRAEGGDPSRTSRADSNPKAEG